MSDTRELMGATKAVNFFANILQGAVACIMCPLAGPEHIDWDLLPHVQSGRQGRLIATVDIFSSTAAAPLQVMYHRSFKAGGISDFIEIPGPDTNSFGSKVGGLIDKTIGGGFLKRF